LYFGQSILTIEAYTDGLDGMTASRVEWYAKTIEGIIEEHGGALSIFTEVELPKLKLAEGVFLSGHPDLIVLCKDQTTLLFDYKFNFLDVPRASQNLQLMGYVCLANGSNLYFDPIYAYLTAGGNKDPFTGTVYDHNARAAAYERLAEIANAATSADAPRIPSPEACKYCPAKCTSRCPETMQEISGDGSTSSLMHRIELLPSDKKTVRELWDRVRFVASLCESFEKRVKAEVMADPEAWADYFTLQSTGCTRTVKDAQAAYREIVETNGLMDAETFLSLVSLPIGKLEEACKPALRARGIPVKEQKEYIAGILGDNLESKGKAPSVKVVGDA
jgi:hypothetical protein